MKLEEIFNYTIEDLVWQQNGRFELSSFIIGDGQFQLQIEKKDLEGVPEFNTINLAEVSFSRKDLDDMDSNFKTQRYTQSPTKVYGAVTNALSVKFKEYDAFYFKVYRRHSDNDLDFNTKKRIYMQMADRVKGSVPCWYYELEDVGELTIVVSKVRVSDETSKRTGLINPLKEAMLATGMNVGCAWYDKL